MGNSDNKTKPHLMVSSKSGEMTVSKKADLGVASWIVLLASQLPSLNRLSQEVWYSLKIEFTTWSRCVIL